MAVSPPPTPRGAFAALGAGCARRRWWVIGVWAAILLLLGGFAPRLADQLSPGGFEIAGSSSERARTAVLERFAGVEFPTSLTLVVHGARLGPGDPGFDAVVARARTALRRDPLVGAVSGPLAGRDGRTAFLQVGIDAGLDDALKAADRFLAAAASAATPAVSVQATGGPAIFKDFDKVNERDLRLSESVQVPIVLLILLLVLGSLIAAGLPVLATVLALTVTLGGLYFVAGWVDLSIYVQNVVPLVGIGVAVDYSLFLVSRFREELARGRDPAAAAAATTATAGRAIFFSGLTVVVALAGMFAVGVPIFTGFAVGTIAVVGVAVAVGLTLLPAVLAALGQRVNRVPVGDSIRAGLRRVFHVRGRPEERWARWAEAIMRRPWPFLLGSSALMLALAVPVLWMSLGSSGASALPRDVASIRASDRLAAEFGPGATAPVRIVVDGHGRDLRRGPAIADLHRALAGDREVAVVQPGARFTPDGRFAFFQLLSRHGEDDQRSIDLVGRIEDRIAPGVRSLAGAEVLVGGAASQNRDFNRTVASNLPRVIGIVMLLTFLVLVVLFRSLLLPLKAVLMTLLSALAAYGVLVMVFQWGWGDSLLGFEHLGHVTSWVPPFLFAILFGLSMDYEVFLLTRVREHYERHGDDRAAVAWGLARSGGVITAAAAIMVVVFLSFLLNRLIPIKEASLGLAVAVFLDATIVRIVLVPAFMRIAGRWNWWLPGPLDRLLPRHDEGELGAAPTTTPEAT
ncbi:MAG TPA: efflux RND transporter permease subunit [Miltoncostaeaceae bacterium]|nr:efflux RND transporter permease subunit [Miltoncostaeaceae bacterium]